MPNGDSLFSTSFAAGKSVGEIEAEKINVQAFKDTITSETEKMGFRQEKISEGIDLFATAVDTASTLYEGHVASKEIGTFQKGIQQRAAKEQFGKEYTPEQLETLSPKKLGLWGTEWGDASKFEKAVSYATGGSKWRFGEGEGAYTMGKSDIKFVGEAAKYGVKTDLSMYKEAGGDTKFYGEKRGPDWGDVVGEKSVFAAGQEKLSSILSEKTEKKVVSSDPMKYGGGGEVFPLDFSESISDLFKDDKTSDVVLGKGTVLRPKDDDIKIDKDIPIAGGWGTEY